MVELVKTGRVCLGDVADFVNGAAFKPEDWGPTGARIIRIQNLNDPSKPYNRTERVVPQKLHVQPGDLLVSWSASLGVFVWDHDDTALLNQHIFRVIPNDERVDKDYLRHMLTDALDSMKRHLHGATMMHVNRKEFLSTSIPLPPLDEQRRIAAILDKADELRTKRREALAHLDTLTQSIFHSMFGDVVRNQRRWSVEAFDQVTTSRLGKMLDKKVQTGNFRFKYLRNANVQWFRIETHDLLEMDFSPADQLEFSLRYGDVLICEGGEPGRAAIWRDEVQHCYFQKALHRARPNPNRLTSEYLVQLLWTLAKGGGLDDHVTVATIAHLTGEKLKRLRIPVPPLELQQTFAARVAAVERLKELHRKHLAELDALFASLQHRAFKGEL